MFGFFIFMLMAFPGTMGKLAAEFVHEFDKKRAALREEDQGEDVS